MDNFKTFSRSLLVSFTNIKISSVVVLLVRLDRFLPSYEVSSIKWLAVHNSWPLLAPYATPSFSLSVGLSQQDKEFTSPQASADKQSTAQSVRSRQSREKGQLLVNARPNYGLRYVIKLKRRKTSPIDLRESTPMKTIPYLF